MLNKIKKFFMGLLTPRPTLFDLCISVFVFIPWIKGDQARSIFIVFYTAFLVAYSLSLKPKRSYRSLPLSLLTVWSLIGVFIHSFAVYPTSRTSLYVNYYLMIEGFLFIFFAVLFITTVIKYSTNIKFIYLLLPIGIYPWISDLQRTGNVTVMAAIGASIFLYLVCSKRYKLSIPVGLIGLTGVIIHWKWVYLKFFCRPKVWSQLFINMFYRPVRYVGKDIVDPGIELSPWLEKFMTTHLGEHLDKCKPWLATIFGGGFSQTLDPNYIWVSKNNYGWLYRQNDYLALGMDLGVIATILVIWFIIDSVKKIGVSAHAILFWAVTLVCMFQVTMYIPYKAGIWLMVIALCLTNGVRGRHL